ncbi:MAG: amidohydrolase family protein [Nitrososphaerota archaeon]
MDMIIDVHAHIGEFPKQWSQEWFDSYAHLVGDPLRSVLRYFPIEDKFLADMDEAGVNVSVVMGFVHYSTSTLVPDEHVYNFVKSNPDRLIGFSCVQPIDSRNEFNARGLLEFETAVTKYGFRGLKFLPVYNFFFPNDRRAYPFYEKALELNVPVMFHSAAVGSTAACMKYGHPMYLEDVVMDFPKLKMCVSHMAFPWTEEALLLVRKAPNMYMDVSAMVRPTILTWNLVKAKEYGVIHKLMFGSDYPLFGPRKNLVEIIRDKVNQIAERTGWPTLTDEEIEGILWKNALKFLELK